MKSLGEGFYLVHSAAEVQEVERNAGYRGHDDKGLDTITGADPDEYPAIVKCFFDYETQSGRDCYRTIVFSLQLARELLRAKTNAKTNEDDHIASFLT